MSRLWRVADWDASARTFQAEELRSEFFSAEVGEPRVLRVKL